MTRGRHTCNTLKAIRKQIADANDIRYEPRKCTYEGDCAGTCPACEAEVRYLESELSKRSRLGRAVAVVGVAASMVGLTACSNQKSEKSTEADVRSVSSPVAKDSTLSIPEEIEIQQPSTDNVTTDSQGTPEEDYYMGEADVPQTSTDADNAQHRVVATDSLRPLKKDEEPLFVGEIIPPQPEFPGGIEAMREYLSTNIRYPEDSLEGRVVVAFTVEADGSITNANVKESFAPAYGDEVLRVVKAMPKWKPGMGFDGKPAALNYILPVVFSK